MKILAIDTSAAVASAAVSDNGKLLALYTVNAGRTHSEVMLSLVESVLKSLKLDINNIDMFACAAGPGSFTGGRIGVSIIKGLAFGTAKPCAAVSTLSALAENIAGIPSLDGCIISPVMDARRSQLYNALFADGKRLTPDRLISAENLAAELAELRRPVMFTGDGYFIAREAFDTPLVMETPEALRYQNAFSVATAALAQYKSGEGITDAERLSPVYLRPSQAERELAKRQIQANIKERE